MEYLELMWIIGIAVGLVMAVAGFLLFRKSSKRSREAFRKKIESFESGPQMSNEDYLAELGFEPESAQAFLAIGLREHIADYSQIPLMAVLSGHELGNDYDQLLFDVSHDVLDFIFRLEKKLDIRVSRHIFSDEREQTVQDLTLRLIDEMKITPEGKYSVSSFIKPGFAPGIGGLYFCFLSVIFFAVAFLLASTGIIRMIILCICFLCAVPGGVLLIWALKDLICADINDRKVDEKCSDCSSLVQQVETYGYEGPGQRWSGVGAYCRKCKELKRCEPKFHGER